MRVCVILEGCYPYVTGGVSTWMHQYIKAMPEHEFVLLTVSASSEDQGKFKYELPDNVVEIREIFLQDALKLQASGKRYRFGGEELQALTDFVHCKSPDWNVLFHMYNDKKMSPMSFLTSQEFLGILIRICEKDYPYTAFSDMFHTLRSMFLPVLYIISQDIPKADVYHAIATGYSGLLARLGSYKYHAPCMLTEHGIYTREREEEIIRARWVPAAFKRFWVRFFYMLSDAIYSEASMITSLFDNARRTQIELGCRSERCRVIPNGIHYERFCNIPLKKEDGWIDIGAIVRLAPIKDIKTLIYSFYELRFRMKNVRLHIIGPEDDKEYAKECYALVEQLGVEEVIFTGMVNILEYMEKLDFTILTSISEGQPLSVLESFAAGRPCVTTDVGCCRELLNGMEGDSLGSAGICTPPMEREALCAAMERMSSRAEERYRMGQVGKRRVELYYRHNDMVRNYRNVYTEVMTNWRESVSP